MYNEYPMRGNLYENPLANQKVQEKKQQIELEIFRATQLGHVKICETEAKAVITEAVRTDGYERRLRLREEAKEKARAVVEVLDVDDNGRLFVISKNTTVAAKPRGITNMSRPEIIIIRCTNPLKPACYKLTCKIADKKACLFLASEKVGKGNYLLNKLISAGIYFEIQHNKIKPLMLQLLGKLIVTCDVEELVPETEGWVRLPDGRYRFYSEEDLTWKKITALSK